MKDSEKKVVVTTWSEKGGGNLNQFLERLQVLEKEGVPVYICDMDSCRGVAEELGIKNPGETVVYQQGAEKGRLDSSGDADTAIAEIKKLIDK
jgi:sulfur relay (sulfurtransferase) complex TusBCD TusD component (DsrE family)